MGDKEKDIFKQGMESPSNDFISKIMGEINVEEAALSNLCKREGKVMPSDNFTANLMSKIETQSLPEYESVISKKAWVGIAVVSITLIVLSFYLSPSDIEIELNDNIQTVNDPAISPTMIKYIILMAFCTSVLLAAEQWLTRRKIS